MNAAQIIIAQRGTGKRLWYVGRGHNQNRDFLAVSRLDGGSESGRHCIVLAALPHGRPQETQRKECRICQRILAGERQRPIAALTAGGASKMPCYAHFTPVVAPQHFLAFLPEPQGQGSLRPTLVTRWGTICELLAPT